MLSTIGKAAIRRSGLRSTDSVARLAWQLQRVCVIEKGGRVPLSNSTIPSSQLPGRFYATATKSAPAAKPRARKAAPKKAASKKAAAKPKPKKVLTEKQIAARAAKKAKDEVKVLKATALLEKPKELPKTAWNVMIQERLEERKSEMGKGGARMTSIITELASEFKSMDASTRERYNHIANQNKEANELAFKRWVESHTPDQIRQANLARLQLKRKDGKGGSKKYTPIADPRLPKRARAAHIIFLTQRYSSGDMKGIPFTDASTTIHKEWNGLSTSEKQRFQAIAEQEKRRYIQDYKAVFHRDHVSNGHGHAPAAAAAASA